MSIQKMVMEKIISEIKNVIAKRQVSEQWISDKTGIPQSTVHRLVSGKNKKLDLPKIRLIQSALGIIEDENQEGSILKIKELPPSKQLAVDIIVNAMSEDEALDFVLDQRSRHRKKAAQQPT